jgi:hypothetical protein
MASAGEISGDITAAASALAGLLLVYIGSLSASFATYQPTERRAVVSSYKRRAWFAFIGLAIFLVTVVLSLFGKLLVVPCLVLAALALLIIATIWTLVTAIFTVQEIG